MRNVATELPDAARRRCYDCAHMRAYVTWWCTNDAAIRARGTGIPGVCLCPFWAPASYRPPRSPLGPWSQRVLGALRDAGVWGRRLWPREKDRSAA